MSVVDDPQISQCGGLVGKASSTTQSNESLIEFNSYNAISAHPSLQTRDTYKKENGSTFQHFLIYFGI